MLYIVILRHSISRPFSIRFALYYQHCTGGARLLVARARAPVWLRPCLNVVSKVDSSVSGHVQSMLSKSHSNNGPEIQCVNWQMASLCVFGCHCGVTTRLICLNTHHNFVQLSQWGNYTSNLFEYTPQLRGIHPPGLLRCVGWWPDTMYTDTQDLLVPEYEYDSKTTSVLTKNQTNQ